MVIEISGKHYKICISEDYNYRHETDCSNHTKNTDDSSGDVGSDKSDSPRTPTDVSVTPNHSIDHVNPHNNYLENSPNHSPIINSSTSNIPPAKKLSPGHCHIASPKAPYSTPSITIQPPYTITQIITQPAYSHLQHVWATH